MMVVPFLLLVVAALVATIGLRRSAIWVWIVAMAAFLYTLSLRAGDFLQFAP